MPFLCCLCNIFVIIFSSGRNKENWFVRFRMWLICENWNLFLKFHSQVMLLYCFEVNCARFPFRTFWSLKWYLSCCKCLYILSKLILFMWSTLVFSFFGFRFNNMVIAQSIKISIRNCVPALKFVGNAKKTNLDRRIYILVRWPSCKNRSERSVDEANSDPAMSLLWLLCFHKEMLHL